MSKPNVRVVNLNLKPADGALLLQLTVEDLVVTLAAADVEVGATLGLGIESWNANEVPLGLINLEGGDVRVRWDGQDPTASLGMLLQEGVFADWSRKQLEKARFIAADVGTPATIWVSPMTD